MSQSSAAESPEAQANLFGWLAGVGQQIVDHELTRRYADFPEQAPTVDPTAPMADTAQSEEAAGLRQELDRNRNTLLMIGGAAALVVFVVLVKR